MQNKRSTAESIAEDYYDSADADKFYEKVWGGEDIHVGLYEADLSIEQASRNTVTAMVERLGNLNANSKVIDLGSGYGGSARYLAKTKGCHVTCLNLSDVQNARNRMLNEQQGLTDKVSVLHGSFESIPAEDSSFDLVWSQDAFLHSNQKQLVMKEIERVLKPGGEVIFTDPMQADNCPSGVLQSVLERLSLDSFGSFEFYTRELEALNFEQVECLELTHQLRNHYSKVKESLSGRYAELTQEINPAYIDRMIQGLENWVKAANSGYLAWGILHFRKRAN
ncbi:SAM-dependent methyltransferase [Candidatus Nitrotoga sp. M5]|uniref:SAM-dependent methyltransferase n=1 Tax=Candidatus Nitrotoga sp. M5 TaxID=2890409 RepID=UPI001EF1A125|nr:methyltransferase domain-containing protein [Candidatus Nitrotoga sp. M5]CAH1385879.1 Sarcosine/dimethylglycine N-methyltransferase [Candidatus Nitrotoga sp. M5]